MLQHKDAKYNTILRFYEGKDPYCNLWIDTVLPGTWVITNYVQARNKKVLQLHSKRRYQQASTPCHDPESSNSNNRHK